MGPIHPVWGHRWSHLYFSGPWRKWLGMAPNAARRIFFLLIQTLPTFWAERIFGIWEFPPLSFCGSKICGFPGPQIFQIWPAPGQAWTLGVGVRCWLLIIAWGSASFLHFLMHFGPVAFWPLSLLFQDDATVPAPIDGWTWSFLASQLFSNSIHFAAHQHWSFELVLKFAPPTTQNMQ